MPKKKRRIRKTQTGAKKPTKVKIPAKRGVKGKRKGIRKGGNGTITPKKKAVKKKSPTKAELLRENLALKQQLKYRDRALKGWATRRLKKKIFDTFTEENLSKNRLRDQFSDLSETEGMTAQELYTWALYKGVPGELMQW